MASSTAGPNTATARSSHFLVSIGLCLLVLTGCSRPAPDTAPADRLPSPVLAPTADGSGSSPDDVPPAVPARVLLLSRVFVESALNFDACSRCSDAGFLLSAEMLSTRTELRRLERSQRAHLPWAAMQARHERSRIEVIDTQARLSRTDTWRVVVSGTRTIRTNSATSRSFVQVRLTVIGRGDGWKVTQAWGAGL